MNKEECMQQIFEKLLEIRKIYLEFNPKGSYLNLAFSDKSVNFNNAHWEGGDDEDAPIWFFRAMEDIEDEV